MLTRLHKDRHKSRVHPRGPKTDNNKRGEKKEIKKIGKTHMRPHVVFSLSFFLEGVFFSRRGKGVPRVMHCACVFVVESVGLCACVCVVESVGLWGRASTCSDTAKGEHSLLKRLAAWSCFLAVSAACALATSTCRPRSIARSSRNTWSGAWFEQQAGYSTSRPRPIIHVAWCLLRRR